MKGELTHLKFIDFNIITNSKKRLIMDPLSMEKAMIKNMIDKTGKSIDEWIEIVKKQNFVKHNEIVTFF